MLATLMGVWLLTAYAADAAPPRCKLDQFRLRSTGACVAKNSALGRKYYHGGNRAERRHVMRRSARKLQPPPPAEPPEDAVWPVLTPEDLLRDEFEQRFYFGTGERQ